MTNAEAIKAKEKGIPVVAFGVKYRCIKELTKEYISNRRQQGYVLRAYLECYCGHSVTKVRIKDIKYAED